MEKHKTLILNFFMGKNEKSLIIILLFLALVAVIFFILRKESTQEREITVTTTTYPLFSLIKEIGGERVEVVNITPSGRDPLGYFPPQRSIERVKNSDLFLFNGAGLEPWIREKEEEIKEKTVLIETSSYFHTIKTKEGRENPHLWMDPLIFNEKARIVLKKLIEVDKSGEDYYQKNAKRVSALLDELHIRYKNELSFCEIKEINFPENTLDYLAKRYNFKVNQGSQEERADLTVPLNPPQREIQQENYFSILRENLQELKKIMKCR